MQLLGTMEKIKAGGKWHGTQFIREVFDISRLGLARNLFFVSSRAANLMKAFFCVFVFLDCGFPPRKNATLFDANARVYTDTDSRDSYGNVLGRFRQLRK